jgi:transposase
MVKPSKKPTKSEDEVAAEARRKKEILDKVAQSNLPTKTILKELGISRSTYYSWLKRYEEEGDEGLLDSRSLSKGEEDTEKAVPSDVEVETRPTAKVETEDRVEERPEETGGEEVKEKEEELAFPPPEEIAAEASESAAPSAAEQPQIREGVSPAKKGASFGGGQGRKGLGAYALIAVVVLVLGLLFSLSLSNYNSYRLKERSDTLTLWRGKFAPRGYEMVESFDPIAVGDADLSELTGKTYTSKTSVYKALFTFFMDQAAVEAGKGNKADIAKIDTLLDRAGSLIGSDIEKKAGVTSMRFQLAKQRVTMAELAVQKAYQEALPVYQEALKAGVGDSVALESKVEDMKKALGMVKAVTPEGQSKEISETPEEAEEGKETETAAPAPPEAQEVESSVASEGTAEEEEAVVTGAPEAEAQKTEVQEAETEEGSETSTKEDETLSGESESGSAGEPGKSEEKAEKPTSFMEWMRSKRAQH